MKNDKLVNAIISLINCCNDMGDYLEDTVSFLADEANIAYDEVEDDSYETLEIALDTLIIEKSAALPEFLDYYFTEDIYFSYILNAFVSDPKMKDNLKIIYIALDDFPGGNKVKSDLASLIFSLL